MSVGLDVGQLNLTMRCRQGVPGLTNTDIRKGGSAYNCGLTGIGLELTIKITSMPWVYHPGLESFGSS